MKMFRLSLLSLFMAMVLIACSSDEEEGPEPAEDETPDTEEGQDDTQEDVEETEEGADEDANESSDEENGNDEHLSLGDTAEINSGSGDYEITVNSFELLDEFEGEQPTRDTFILVEFEVENIGDSPIVAEDIYGATIFDTEELSAENTFHYDSIDVFGDEEIQPGETKEGKYVFSHTESDTYFLHINFGILDSVATNVIYDLPVEEASN